MNVAIEVLRAFSLDGKRVDPGRRVTVGDGLAAELIAAGKAVRVRVNNSVPSATAPPVRAAEQKPRSNTRRAQREQE